MTGGQGIVAVQNKQYPIKDGDMMIILPQTVHSIKQLDNNKMEYFNILFQFSLLNGRENDSCCEKYFKSLYDHTKTVPDFLPADNELNLLLRPYISDLMENRRLSYTQYELMIKSDLLAVMHHLNKYADFSDDKELSLKTSHDKLKNMLLYVQSNYFKPISVDQAADICGFSGSHFMRLFKELTGKTFTQYLKDFRLEKAADLLFPGTQKIVEISENTGFNNLSYFTRSFAEKYGVSPSAYRKRLSCSYSSGTGNARR